MALRANWKGFIRLSLVTCPVALFPATSESQKISFNQINRKTGHRIRYQKVDADTGDEVASEDIIKGYKVDTDTYLDVTTNREHIIALEAREKGLLGMLLRYPYEVRDAAEYFDEIQDVKTPKICSIWRSISWSRNPRTSTLKNLRTVTKERWRNCSTRNVRVSRSRRQRSKRRTMSSI
jgi:non-homologous end joining protein Ku